MLIIFSMSNEFSFLMHIELCVKVFKADVWTIWFQIWNGSRVSKYCRWNYSGRDFNGKTIYLQDTHESVI